MICVSILDVSKQDCMRILSETNFAEIRIDKLSLNHADVKEIFSSHPKLIATCREGKYLLDERLNRLKIAMDSGAKFVDVDQETDIEFIQEVISYAKKKNVTPIVSYHNFNTTPSMEELKRITERCFTFGGSIAKVVTTCNTEDDRRIIMGLYAYYKNLIAFGMGLPGKVTRVMATTLGAPFTYAMTDEGIPAAPGQITVSKMQEAIDILKNL